MNAQPVAHLFDDAGNCTRCHIHVAEWLALVHSESLLTYDCDAILRNIGSPR